jgi:Flp pilus assembly protein TadD
MMNKTPVLLLLLFLGMSYAANAADFTQTGLEKLLNHNYNGAIADFTTAIEFNRTNAVAYCDRGLAWEDKGDDRLHPGYRTGCK